jgi:cell fate (sporulation/competence/biofilm development) regulator YlbF (YheA/YmcA/DUF963 family)
VAITVPLVKSELQLRNKLMDFISHLENLNMYFADLTSFVSSVREEPFLRSLIMIYGFV